MVINGSLKMPIVKITQDNKTIIKNPIPVKIKK